MSEQEPAPPRPRPVARFQGPILGRKTVRMALVVSVALAMLFVMLSPLTGVPGPESALVLGLILPPFVAAAGARLAIEARTSGLHRTGELLERATWLAGGCVALPTAILAINGLRVPWCAPWEGLAFVALGPGIGVLLAAFVGVAIGTLFQRPRLATTIAVLVPILAALGSASLLYTSPAIFGYGHFFGYFPGTLYDPDIEIGTPYLTFRVLSGVQIGGFVALILASVDPRTARISGRYARTRIGSLIIATSFFGAALYGEYRATDLGHRSTAESIAQRLGTTLHGRICDVVVPRELARERAERLRDDCDLRVEQTAQGLGVEQRERVTAFFFRSTSEKRELMGASGTYIAKPWRNEVYLQLSGWPHPVLAHEIVHVVAGNAGVGPFRISGKAGGWLPSPGIIEGVAVALSWEERDGLTPHQWARAMMSLEMMPSVSQTEGLGFLLQPASRAYVTSGSFVRWVLDTRGPDVVRAIYQQGEYEGPLGMPLEEAEVAWREYLRTEVPLPPEALAMAEARFERPAIFAQVCPHRVAALMDVVADDLAAGDDRHAAETCEEVLDIDPNDTRARAWMAVALAREGQLERARRELDRLIGPPSASRPVIRAARQGIADALWAQGNVEEAAVMYRAILHEPLGDEEARQIEVRLLAVESGLPGGEHLREVFAPDPDAPHDAVTAMQAIMRLREIRPDGLGSYLEARQMIQRERFDRAEDALREAQSRGLPSERLSREARRMRAIVEFAMGRRRRSRAIWEDVLEDPSASEASRVEALDWIDRIERAGETTEPIDGEETRVEDAAALPEPTDVEVPDVHAHPMPPAVQQTELPVTEGVAPP
ncbi:tetratricopeptide repeat protein [Sandaracinus amylolyticus]|uniref:tetratricopeptide repeat protein n=1 Tax=Sandaracinus amylolyticus TaxID=927083 RepID=UPI001F2962E1|nr:tetratricopeptide repeat protein [Sandaracinus amylolyticus]